MANNEIVFARRAEGEVLIVAANADKEHTHVEVFMGHLDKAPGTPLVGIWGDGADCGCINDEYKVRIHLPPYGCRIFSLGDLPPAPEAEPPAQAEASNAEPHIVLATDAGVGAPQADASQADAPAPAVLAPVTDDGEPYVPYVPGTSLP
jgi:hypothetical protein